jgi:hypothetical protein
MRVHARADARNPYLQASRSVAKTLAVATGRPLPPDPLPVPIRCPVCRHFTLRHTSAPGVGCTNRGCLCLETPQLILKEAIR